MRRLDKFSTYRLIIPLASMKQFLSRSQLRSHPLIPPSLVALHAPFVRSIVEPRRVRIGRVNRWSVEWSVEWSTLDHDARRYLAQTADNVLRRDWKCIRNCIRRSVKRKSRLRGPPRVRTVLIQRWCRGHASEELLIVVIHDKGELLALNEMLRTLVRYRQRDRSKIEFVRSASSSE
jgi:hypothetical protein